MHAVYLPQLADRPIENGPWAWNTSLTRDKEPTCPEPGLSLWTGLSFLFQAQLMPFEA